VVGESSAPAWKPNGATVIVLVPICAASGQLAMPLT
jgi:hypothetical protein